MIDQIAKKVSEGGRVDAAEALHLYRTAPTHLLGSLADAIRDLPTWASVARQRQGGDIELGDEDDTVSAALQKELQRELLARGVDAQSLVDEELEAALQQLMSGGARQDVPAAAPGTGEPGHHDPGHHDGFGPQQAAG